MLVTMFNQRLCWLPVMLMFQHILCRAWASQPQATLDHDALECVHDNTPVCGRVGSEYLVFANECDRLKARRAKLLDELHDEPLHYCLPNCDFTCSPQRKPICGVSVNSGVRKTFNNMCELSLMSCYTKSEWRVYRMGECANHGSELNKLAAHPKDKQQHKQPLPCTNVLRPVCASYAAVKSTFPNECLVNAENIKRGQNWQILSEGFCEEDKHRSSYKKYAENAENAERKQQREDERKKRSIDNEINFDDLQLGAETVYIYAPSAFHTHFISKHGTFEKRYTEVNSNEDKTSTTLTPTTTATNNNANRETNAFDIDRTDNNEYNVADHDCEFFCDSYYEPLCVSRNGVNYTMVNNCYLRSAKCRDPKSVWQVIDERECPSPAPTNVFKNEYVTERPGFRYTSGVRFTNIESFVEQKPRNEILDSQTVESEMRTTETQAQTPTITKPPSTTIVPVVEPTTTIFAIEDTNVVPSTESTTIMSFTTTRTTTDKPITTTSLPTSSIFRITNRKSNPRPNLTTRKFTRPTRKSHRHTTATRSQARRTKHKSRKLLSKTSNSYRSKSRPKSVRYTKTPTPTPSSTTKLVNDSTDREAGTGSLTTFEQPPRTTTTTTMLDLGSNEKFLQDYLRKEQESTRRLISHLDEGINWKAGERTSIYGTDGNSFMMRLLRAKLA